LDLCEFIQRASILGYDSVMLMGKRPHLSPLDATDALLDRIRAQLDRTSVHCSVIAGYTDFSGGGAAEVPSIEMQIGYVESLSRIAARFGANIVRVFTAYESDRISPAASWERAIAGIRECCDRAERYGVRIAIQNHHDVGVHPDALIEFLREVNRPNCTLGFDAWSVSLLGLDPYETAKRMAPHVSLTTNADYVRLPRANYRPELVNYETGMPDLLRAVPFGEGFIDYSAFFAGLRDGGFDGIAAYEMCSPLRGGGGVENLDNCAKRYSGWMHNFLKTPSARSAGGSHRMGERP
jgi:sugar phosphate isomerase/epimerase